MVTVYLDSPSCEVTLFDTVTVVYRDATRQAKGLYRLKYVGALWNGLAYLSRYNSGWFCHITKTTHFLPVHTTYNATKYAEIYLDQIVRLHGIPKTIISDHGAQFIARFWEQLQDALGTKLIRSSAHHPQTNGQTERVHQILEDMLRACVLQYDKNWGKCLPLAEFSYNNSYQTSLKMAPLEALYGRRYRTPLSWSQTASVKSLDQTLSMRQKRK
jgi:hypothetical protein